MLFGYAGESDASKTVALYQKGCDLGGQYACANLAFAVSQGMGTGKQDIAKGLEIAQHACDNNNDLQKMRTTMVQLSKQISKHLLSTLKKAVKFKIKQAATC